MFDGKWKILIVSFLVYRVVLTWCMFDLVDTAAYLARTDCGARCNSQLFGFILTNQGGSNAAHNFFIASVLLVSANVAVWIWSAFRKR